MRWVVHSSSWCLVLEVPEWQLLGDGGMPHFFIHPLLDHGAFLLAFTLELNHPSHVLISGRIEPPAFWFWLNDLRGHIEDVWST